MTRRRKTCAALFATFILFVAYLWLRPDAPGTFTKANFDKVRVGMTRDEVESLLGPPTGPRVFDGEPVWYWQGWHGDAIVDFDRDADRTVVQSKRYSEFPWRVRFRMLWERALYSPAPF
jgi:hypothetical protein